MSEADTRIEQGPPGQETDERLRGVYSRNRLHAKEVGARFLGGLGDPEPEVRDAPTSPVPATAADAAQGPPEPVRRPTGKPGKPGKPARPHIIEAPPPLLDEPIVFDPTEEKPEC